MWYRELNPHFNQYCQLFQFYCFSILLICNLHDDDDDDDDDLLSRNMWPPHMSQ